MNNCQSIEKNLIAYLDGQAGPAERRQVETHLDECATCRQRAEEFRALWGLLDEIPATEPSAIFDARVRATIAAEPSRRAWWRAIVPTPRLAFAATALIALSIWMVSFRQQTRPPVVTVAQVQQQGSDADFGAIMQLQTLENYDVLANFDALSELPTEQPAKPKR